MRLRPPFLVAGDATGALQTQCGAKSEYRIGGQQQSGRHPHQKTAKLLIFEPGEAPGGGGELVHGKQRNGGEGQQGAKQRHLHAGHEKDKKRERRAGIENGHPQRERGGDRRRMHQPIGTLLRNVSS